MDLLARLHLEFLLDPLDLGLRTIVLTGEIASKRTLAHLAGEFGATVTEVLASPFGGGALAWREAEEQPLRPLADGLLGLAALDKDVPATADGPAELVVTPSAHSSLGDAVLRTGLVARIAEAGEIPAPAHTVGEHVLVRGVWLALPRIEKALSRIDGVAGWELAISRQGTLDTAVLKVTFARRSLVGNPMWKGRIEQAVRALTPRVGRRGDRPGGLRDADARHRERPARPPPRKGQSAHHLTRGSRWDRCRTGGRSPACCVTRPNGIPISSWPPIPRARG
ncbi:hypothetical protein GCM10020220_065440 [Nonomuraea rubra]|uniref:hypothetical protein n=1 Tax=Nonomuraea rubra TaxID=46180 RepID=UPI0031ED3838